MIMPTFGEIQTMSLRNLKREYTILRETCAAQDAAAQMIQKDLIASAISRQKLREALKKLGAIVELSTTTSVDGGDFSDALAKAKDVLALPKTQAEKEAIAGQAAREVLWYLMGSPYKCVVCHGDLEQDPKHSDCPEPVCPGKVWHEAEAEVK